MHHPTLASPCAIASTTWNRVAGSTSSPSQRARDQQAEQPRVMQCIEHVIGNAPFAFDAIAGALDQRGKLARPADQLAGAALPIGGASAHSEGDRASGRSR